MQPTQKAALLISGVMLLNISKNQMNTMKLIGYYASFQGDRAILNEENSVIVFGNKNDFINYHENHPEKVNEIPTYEKIYFDEIMQSIYEGYSFAFDEIAYKKFFPVAKLNGFDFGPVDFSIETNNNYEKKFATLKVESTQNKQNRTVLNN